MNKRKKLAAEKRTKVESTAAYKMWWSERRKAPNPPKNPYHAYMTDRGKKGSQAPLSKWRKAPNRSDIGTVDSPTGSLPRRKQTSQQRPSSPRPIRLAAPAPLRVDRKKTLADYGFPVTPKPVTPKPTISYANVDINTYNKMSLKEQSKYRAYQYEQYKNYLYDQRRKYENMFREDGRGFF